MSRKSGLRDAAGHLPSPRLPSALEMRAAKFKTALTTITAILDEVESDRLENNVDIDVDELIAGIRKQLRNAWGL